MGGRIGPYDVVEEVARGGMGAVFRARDPRLDRSVALKVLLRGDDPRHTQRLIREAESLARLRHPHIVRVHDVLQEEGRPVLVLEWVEGESLQRRLDRAGPLEPRAAVEVARSLAEALAYAHGQGVLHRDLKPGNVMLDAEDRPRLTDFGIARLLDETNRLSKTGAMLGSPEFWAPEQAAGQRDQVGPWTDVYGLGGTLYASLTGTPPFEASTLMELAVAAAQWTPEPPSARADGVDPALDAICLRCLAKDPADRYESAADLADALEVYLAGEAAGRSRGLAGVLSGAVVLGVVSAAWSWGRGAPASPGAGVAAVPSEVVAVKTGVAPVDRAAFGRLIARARARVELKEFHAAQAAVEEALALQPESAAAYGLRAQILLGLGRRVAARQDIERAAALGGSADADYARAVAHYQQDRPRQALTALDATLRRDPNHRHALLDRAAALQQLKRLPEAVRDLERAVSLAPNQVRSRVTLGSVLLVVGRAREALAHFDRALELKPKHHAALWQRASAHSALGNREAAVRDFERALAIDPNHALTRYNRALMRRNSKDFRGALEDFDVALRTQPDFVDALCARASLRTRLRDFAGSERDLGRAWRLRPQDFKTSLGTIELRLAQKRYREALVWAERVVRARPGSADGRFLRGKALFFLNRFEAAIADFSKAHAGADDAATRMLSLDYRARSYASTRRYREGAADLRRILKLLPPGHRAHFSVGQALADFERKARAQATRKTEAQD